MDSTKWLLAISVLLTLQANFLGASDRCGTRKHGYVPLVHHGWTVEEGQWPWHVAIFRKQPPDDELRYACGGTLLNAKHLLTAAHCVAKRKSRVPLPPAVFELHLGQQNLSTVNERVQIRDVAKVHVHPEYSALKNDIAVLEMRLAVAYSEYVIPICIDQRIDRDLRNLEGHRGWIAGWGTTETGNVSDGLVSASMTVVGYRKCTENDPVLFANLVSENVFCAGDLNGTSAGAGDSGGGMYFYDGDRWVLRGIVSFAKIDPLKKEVDTSKYTVFTNVQRYLSWIKEIMTEDAAARRPKRISERECDRFKEIAAKRNTSACNNLRHPYSISISFVDSRYANCNGALISENFAITTCLCVGAGELAQVHIQGYGAVDILDAKCHPDFQVHLKLNDLGVVRLAKPVPLSSSVIPACLASDWTENLYDTLVHTGDGYNITTLSRQFFESDEIQVITEERCIKIVGPKQYPVTRPGDFCVIVSDPLRMGLGGVLGSPLQSQNRQTCVSTVVGLWGFGVLSVNTVWSKEKPWVEGYTRISYYLDWIEQVVWGEQLDEIEESSQGNLLDHSVKTEMSTSTVASAPVNLDFVFPDQYKKMRSMH